MENNKTMILSILGVLVLVIAVVGVSFAMYTFSATGTRENTITTGSVSLNFSADQDPLFTLTNQYAMSDAKGLETEGKTFTLKPDLKGTMTIAYEIGFTEITQGTNLTDSLVKVNIKVNDGNEEKYLAGGADHGDTISAFKGKIGFEQDQISGTTTPAAEYLLKDYVFDSGIINDSNKDKTRTYTIRAWIADDYQLLGGEAATANTAYCTVSGVVDSTKTDAASCKAANGTWTQEKATTPETFSFKISVSAAQV